MDILVVDDNNEYRETLVRYFTGKGYQVEGASDGEDGLDRYRKRAHRVILLDLLMPNMGGEEMLYEISTWDEVPVVIVMTVSDRENEYRYQLYEKGCFYYEEKPIDVEEMEWKVRKLMQMQDRVRMQGQGTARNQRWMQGQGAARNQGVTKNQAWKQNQGVTQGKTMSDGYWRGPVRGVEGMPGQQGMQSAIGAKGLKGSSSAQRASGAPRANGVPSMQGMPGVQSVPGLKGLQGRASRKSRDIQRFYECVMNEIGNEEISLGTIAKKLGIGRRRLDMISRELLTISLHDGVRNLRLLRAREICREGEAGNVKELAWMVGYRDAGYFSRLYREAFGSSAVEDLKGVRSGGRKGGM